MAEPYLREVKTLCPVCSLEVAGVNRREGNRIILEKGCPEHGRFVDLVSSDADLYIKKMGLSGGDYAGPCSVDLCSQGMCPHHVNPWTRWAFIEVTTRCNMRCPVCYADSGDGGRDLPLEDVYRIIDRIAGEGSVDAVVLIGGEPTVRDDIFDIIRRIKERGLIKSCYLATNGLKLADPGYVRKLREAGLRRINLAFDSRDPVVCRKIRGSLAVYHAVPKVLENVRKVRRMRVQMTMTVAKGVNDKDVGDALRFALENADVVRQLMVSPQAFCGRLGYAEELLENRLTLECLERLIREQTGFRCASVSFAAALAMAEPARIMGLFRKADAMFPREIHSECASHGAVGETWGGKVYSLLDLWMKEGRDFYDLACECRSLAGRMKAFRRRLSGGGDLRGAVRLRWALAAVFLYFPKYLRILFGYIHPRVYWIFLKAPFVKLLTRRRWRETIFGRRHYQLFIIFLCDPYNFLWSRVPFCMSFHYMLHPRTGEVTKVPFCLYVSNRPAVQRSQAGDPAPI